MELSHSGYRLRDSSFFMSADWSLYQDLLFLFFLERDIGAELLEYSLEEQ